MKYRIAVTHRFKKDIKKMPETTFAYGKIQGGNSSS